MTFPGAETPMHSQLLPGPTGGRSGTGRARGCIFSRRATRETYPRVPLPRRFRPTPATSLRAAPGAHPVADLRLGKGPVRRAFGVMRS
jgi:hypothetical protein